MDVAGVEEAAEVVLCHRLVREIIDTIVRQASATAGTTMSLGSTSLPIMSP